MAALLDDFEQHGATAIRSAREKDPAAYIRVVASTIPKQFQELTPLAELSDEELEAKIAELIPGLIAGLGSGARGKLTNQLLAGWQGQTDMPSSRNEVGESVCQ